MTVHTDIDTLRDFKLAAAIFSAVAVAFAVVGIGAVAAAMPERAVVAPASVSTAREAETPSVAEAPATTAPLPQPPAEDPNAPLAIEVEMGEFSFTPSRITVPAGRQVRFEIVNHGVAPHEFLVGDQHAQDEAEREMAKGSSAGGHVHDDTLSIYLDAGESGVLETTFDAPASLLIGCHVPGHWAAGMKGTLTVT